MKENEHKLNVAVWGLGPHAFKNVLPAIAASDAANLVGVYSREEASRRQAGAEYGCATWPDTAAMLADARVNAVYLATPIGLHFEQGMSVLRAGRHLICEKSLTDSHAKSIGLLAEARQRGLLLCEALMYRYHSRIQSFFDLARREEFGAIVSVSCSFFLPRLDRPGYRYTASLGGGCFWDVACYPISFLLGLVKENLVVEQATFDRTPGVEVDTGGMTLVGWGARGHACLNWGYGVAYRNEATITGENKSMLVEQVFTKGGPRCTEIALRDNHGKEEKLSYPVEDSFVGMLACAKNALRDDQLKRTMWDDVEHQANLMEQIRAFAIRD